MKRLISATASGSMTLAQTYGYDGFGNLLSKTGSGNGGGGGPVSASYLINPATNRPFSGHTAAGLPTSGGFDNDNRMISTLSTSGYSEYFAYSPSGKRVWNQGMRPIDPFTEETVQEVWFWSPQGQRLAQVGAPVFAFKEANLYHGGKLVGQYNSAGAHVLKTSDRLGSFGKYYPYGEERNPTGASGEKFATYFHDNVVGLNYADQRWHANSGRFLTPDPYQASGGPSDPGDTKFRPLRGRRCFVNTETNEVWCRDRDHGDHWEVYKKEKDLDYRDRRHRAVWDSGCIRQRF
ncbi:MAG: hypothetical protein K2X35_18335 [Bryobacteraceae bacterium]|nr:hypothetical protein [Bryobacteraceae bacterium]